ncbi:hypothetical protein B0O80DRAFT_492399 [Mortierella sp. GBAus27b]|nr:hypothetical protein BGX31_004039 [Mortierella sp. GBA43]KAI8363254.1 hypothetical protein B0O80DRAFT_492399 [Mortierella sp. GBAus27b]
MADYSQTWINQSNTPFHKYDCRLVTAAGQVLETVHTRPGEMLKVNESETFSWSQALSHIGTGPFDGYVIWSMGLNDKYKFGVNIHVPTQVFSIGTAPYYKIKVDDRDWEGEYTSDPYVFPTENLPFAIEVKAITSHTTIEVTVRITDKPKNPK